MRLAASLFVTALALPATVFAVTPDELVRLRAAGLGDEVLLALVDTTGVQGRMDANVALDLRHGGLTDRVIAAAIRRAAADEAQALMPQGPIDQPPIPDVAPQMEPPAPVVSEVVPVVPWVVPVYVPRQHGRPTPTLGNYKGFGRFINTDLKPLNTGFIDPPEARTTGAPPRR